MMPQEKVLVVDDDWNTRRTLDEALPRSSQVPACRPDGSSDELAAGGEQRGRLRATQIRHPDLGTDQVWREGGEEALPVRGQRDGLDLRRPSMFDGLHLAIAVIVAAPLWGCTGDGNDAGPMPDDRSAASNSASALEPVAPLDDPDPGADPGVSTSITSGWRADVTGTAEAELPTVGGPAVLVSRTPARTTLTGMVGQSGGALTIGLETFEVGERTALDFNLGFQFQRYRCISRQVVVTLTQIEPKPRGTFSGPVSCEDLAEGADPIDGTVSGEIAG